MEQRPRGVTAAAIVLGLMTCCGFVATLLSFVAMFMVRNPLIPRVPAIQATTAVLNLVLFCFLVFCARTVIGLFRLRPGARIAMIVIGALTAAFFALISAAATRLLSLAPPQMTVPGASIHVSAVLLTLSAIYGVLALVGIWWVVYFSLDRVRRAFTAAK